MPSNSLAQLPSLISLVDDQSEDVDEEEGGGGDSPDRKELSQQIDSHVVVIDEENPTTATLTVIQGAPQSTLGLVPSVSREVPTTT